MLDGRVLGASQGEYKPFGKPPLKKKETVPKLFFRISIYGLQNRAKRAISLVRTSMYGLD